MSKAKPYDISKEVLAKWVRRKYQKRFRRKERKAAHWLGRIEARHQTGGWTVGAG